MTIAHFSDTHLGYRAFGRTTATGFNQREVDVMLTFRQCLDSILDRNPDLVIHSGDLFHIVRPSNATILGAFKAISEFQKTRSYKPLVIVGGNHDTPRVAESGNILKLFGEIPGVELRTSLTEMVDLPDLDCEVLCVPSNSLVRNENIDYVPTGQRKHSVLAIHGRADRAIPQDSQFTVEETRHERWSYVALGDYHVFAQYGANICYSGSTDFTSSNIWEEAGVPKRWVWFDTAVGRLEPVALKTRQVLDLPSVDAQNLSSDELTAAILRNAKWDVNDMPIVRQRVTNVHPDTRARLGPTLVRDLNERCLNYLLRLVPPEARIGPDERVTVERVSLERSWDEHIETAELPAGVERGLIRALGMDLLQEVAEYAANPAEA